MKPESPTETRILTEFASCIKLEPLEMVAGVSSGSSESGSDLFEFIGCQQVERGPLPCQPSDEKPIVPINVGLKVVPKLRSSPSGS